VIPLTRWHSGARRRVVLAKRIANWTGCDKPHGLLLLPSQKRTGFTCEQVRDEML